MKSILSSIIFSTLSCFILCIGCNGNQAPKKEPAEKKIEEVVLKDTPKIETDKKLTEVSKLIAGMDTVLDFKKDLKERSKFIKFHNSSKTKFEKIENSRLNKLNKWSSELLKKNNLSDSSFCFYPFAGGDFIHAHYLYPNAKEYLLMALEPIGTLPDFHTFSEDDILGYLYNVDTVLRNIYYNSYFITKNMINDIKNKKMLDGVLPLIVWGIARANYEIVSIDYFNIDSVGNKIPVSKDEPKIGKSTGVTVQVKNGNEIKKISYISADISDNGVQKNPGVMKFVQQLIPANSATTFIKSASYTLHYKIFNEIRNNVLNLSKVIFQDDTGVPYKYVNNEKWKVELYGEYKAPVKDFSEKLFQEDLDSAYRDKTKFSGPVPFSIGYHWKSNAQNQMFIYKK